MRQIFHASLLVIGVLITLFGIGADHLLPEASPGVNLPQLLVIAIGLAVLVVAALLRNRRFWHAMKGRYRNSLMAALLITIATVIALEIALAVADIPTYYRDFSTDTTLTAAPWWTCDAAGCHYVYEYVQVACETGVLRDRVCNINKQGYSDSEDFELPADWADRNRILLLGDSFTWGLSADLGKSFGETLEAALPDAIIWNTGIPGTGTNQARMVFDVYAPILLPQLTVLSFVPNDFGDNLLPVDSWLNALDINGDFMLTRRYWFDEEENLIEFDLDTLGFIRAHGKQPPSSELERLLGSTRLGTLLLRSRDMYPTPAPNAQSFDRRRQVTKQHLLELNRAIASSGSELLIMLIPYTEDVVDVEGLRPRFRIAQELMRELEIPYLNPISILHPVADYALPDNHWNNAGHQKIGQLLSDCIERFLASEDFAECAHINLP